MNYEFGLNLVVTTIFVWAGSLVPAMAIYLTIHIIRRSMTGS